MPDSSQLVLQPPRTCPECHAFGRRLRDDTFNTLLDAYHCVRCGYVWAPPKQVPQELTDPKPLPKRKF